MRYRLNFIHGPRILMLKMDLLTQVGESTHGGWLHDPTIDANFAWPLPIFP